MKLVTAAVAAAAAASVSAQPAPPPVPRSFERAIEAAGAPRPAPPYPPPPPARPAFAVDYAPQPQGATLVSLRAPEGTPCRISDERGLVAEGGAPLTVRAHPGALYRVELLPAGLPPLAGEVAASAGQVATVWAAAPARAPAPPPVVAGPQPMSPDAFEELLASLRGAPEDRLLDRVKRASRRNWFVVDQVLDLVDAFTFGRSKVRVVELVHDRVLDHEHEGRLLERFTFPPERERVQRILARR